MTPDPVDLLERRAALLGARADHRADHGANGDANAELDRATGELSELIERRPPEIRRVTASEPGDLLERLAAAEPVHPVSGPRDLADRLDDDRRCYVLEHPLLPGRPLNVVWVALCHGVPGDISEVLDPTAPTGDAHAADTAAFYSIWNVEPGFVGLPGGSRLLEKSIDELRLELPALHTFVTLSPIPGFRAWSEQRSGPAGTLPGDTELLRRCARYLVSISDGRPVDRVARFHLGNGARLLALHRHGDRSERGLARSFGIMANYRYEPEDRERNRADLAAGRPAVGDTVADLLAGG